MNIKIKDLVKVYGDGYKALKGLNLEIEPGMFGLLGPNGAGKTTLMRIMTLLQNPSSGTILFDDYDILKDRKAIRSVLGYLPQDFRFFEKLKTWEFLDYGAALLNRGELKFEGSPDDMIKLATGKVWEIFVTDRELQEVKEKYPIISTIPSEGGWDIQVVAEELQGFTGKPIAPNIEHAYVYFMDYLLQDKMDMYSEKIGGELFN